MKPRLIAIEGIDGSGGETQSGLLLEHLKGKGIPAEKLQYPDYASDIGKLIHEWLHNKSELTPEALFLLYATDMVKDQKRLGSWLEQGRTVIADRYITSTMAYQTMQGVPLEKILKFCELFGMRKPDIVIYLEVSPETSMDRKKSEKGSLDRNESRREFLERVCGSYEGLVEKQVFAPWFVVDGEAPKEEVSARIRKILRA